MRRHVLPSSVALAMILSTGMGCSSGGSACDAVKCGSDPKPSIGEQQQCRDIQKGPCSAQYNDERSCIFDHQQCTADGHLDPSSEVTALGACQAKTKAYQDCVAQSGGDAGP